MLAMTNPLFTNHSRVIPASLSRVIASCTSGKRLKASVLRLPSCFNGRSLIFVIATSVVRANCFFSHGFMVESPLSHKDVYDGNGGKNFPTGRVCFVESRMIGQGVRSNL